MASVRGRAACNGCRARKQKCDEARPVCTRCRTLNRPCIWPASRKRGPAKGYTEALEHRLRETENALLRLWMATTEVSVEQAFEESVSLPEACSRSPNEGRQVSPRPASDKSSAVTQWENYPLQTALDVARWAKEAKGATKASETQMAINDGALLDCPPQQPCPPGDAHVLQNTTLDSATSLTPPTPITTFPNLDTVLTSETQSTQEGHASTSTPINHVSRFRTRHREADNALRPSSPSPSSKAKIQLSQEFTDQYLW
ncbi:hypothetical protein BKA56DRAFT_595614 [Ilyonectria sp. MPI-CAGE-AT-0026]|nr:hypothetical protein BKA56DRAFT_595614 [Ilyonectria sp. MPI-CAGE-AT-0026]